MGDMRYVQSVISLMVQVGLKSVEPIPIKTEDAEYEIINPEIKALPCSTVPDTVEQDIKSES